MRILRVASDLYPDTVGGYGIHVHEMSRMQAQLGNDVTVITARLNGNPKDEQKYGYNIKRYTPLAVIYGNTIAPSMLIDIVRDKNSYDIIHAHSHLFMSTIYCALARKLGSSPLVITNHGFESQSVPEWVNNVYNSTIGKWTYNAADTIICYTEEDRSKMVKAGVRPEKIAIIHNGIDSDAFSPAERKDRKNKILWIGRFVRGKGVPYLVKAMALLAKEHQDLKLQMIGNGPLKEEIERMVADLNLGDRVDIKTFVPNTEMPEVYRSADVFVLPSIYEGVPRTVLEAMSCGVPVVCSELPQLADIIKGCGYLVPVKDPQAIADRVSEMLSDEEKYRQFSRNGREKILRDYSWGDTVRKTIGLYEKILER